MDDNQIVISLPFSEIGSRNIRNVNNMVHIKEKEMGVACSRYGISEVSVWACCNWLEGPVVAFCKHDSESSGSIRDGKYIDKYRYCKFLRNNSVPKR